MTNTDIAQKASGSMCPKCGAIKLVAWGDLTPDERLLADRLPASAEYSREERKKHRFCTRCWFEETDRSPDLA
jgi:hypothetical protein